MFRLWAIATDGKMNPSGYLFFKKITLGWMYVWELNPEDGIALAQNICHLVEG
jgi:hypothetical protein